MKLKSKMIVLAIATMTVVEFSYNNSKINKLLVANIEALTDSYEDKIDSNGNTLTVTNYSQELTQEQKDNLKGEMYYISHGLPNPYHWMHTGYDPYLKETFLNTNTNQPEQICKCTSTKALCTGDIKGVCWAILYHFYGC